MNRLKEIFQKLTQFFCSHRSPEYLSVIPLGIGQQGVKVKCRHCGAVFHWHMLMPLPERKRIGGEA